MANICMPLTGTQVADWQLRDSICYRKGVEIGSYQFGTS